MRFANSVGTFGRCTIMGSVERNERNRPSLFVTCSGLSHRNERHTPLGGVTVVTQAGGLTDG